MDELKAQVVFSNQPFEGANPSIKTITDFKAWDEIYGRVNFPQPIKEMLTGYFAGGILSEGALINFELKLEGGETYSSVNKKLSKEDLEKNYIDFDIAPGVTRSRDAYIVDFSDGVAARNTAFEERKKGNFTLSVFFLNSAHERIEEQYISGNLSIDYSALPDGSDGIDKLRGWGRQIATAAQEDQVKENLKKNAKKPAISFSTLPFSNAAHKEVTRIKAGEPLYGRIALEKPLKEYVQGTTAPAMIHLDIKCLNDNVYGIGVDKTLRKSELENAFIDFDVFPTPENAKDVYTSNLGFYFTIFSTGMNPNKVLQFEISLPAEYNTSNNGLKKIEAWGEIEIDYTGVSPEKINELNEKGRSAGEKAEENADKLLAAESAQLIKTLPLPVVFTKPSHTGYKGYSKAVITQMIKEKFHATEVHMLTFDAPDGSGDFSALTDLNNYPTEKMGNHVFYFVFKDPQDGLYKFSGGRLRMLYEGNGQYGEAYIFPYSPVMSGEPEFPVDMIRYKQGFESIFYFDAAKVKK